MPRPSEHVVGRLTAVARDSADFRLQPGLHAVAGGGALSHLLYLPAGGPASDAAEEAPRGGSLDRSPVPLVVMFHGSGSDPLRMLRLVERAAESNGVAVLLPKSSGYTWDAVLGEFGADVAELDGLLKAVSELIPIDSDRVAVGGFSDGASYALSLGRINGDRFRRVLAFSPGFVVPGPPAGTPHMFVTHGTSDAVLPIARCSRLLVPALRREGYEVDYREFDGGHVVPGELVAAGLGPLAVPSSRS